MQNLRNLRKGTIHAQIINRHPAVPVGLRSTACGRGYFIITQCESTERAVDCKECLRELKKQEGKAYAR